MTVRHVPRLLTIADLVDLTQFTERTIRRKIEAGEIRPLPHKVGGHIRVSELEYLAWIGRTDEKTVGPTDAWDAWKSREVS